MSILGPAAALKVDTVLIFPVWPSFVSHFLQLDASFVRRIDTMVEHQ